MLYRKWTWGAAGIVLASLWTVGCGVSQVPADGENVRAAAASLKEGVERTVDSNPAPEARSAERKEAVQELAEMFRAGLALAQSVKIVDQQNVDQQNADQQNADQQNAELEKGAAMVETALVQAAEYPEAYSIFWGIYKPFLEKRSSEDALKVSMIEVFEGAFEETSLQCRSRAEFESFWKVQQEVELFRKAMESKLASGETASAEVPNGADSALEDGEETVPELTLANLQKGIQDLEAKWSQLKKELESEINWDDFNRQTVAGRDPQSTEPFAKGKTYLFMEEIQQFALEKLESEGFTQLAETDSDGTFQIRQKVQELLEKGRLLNQTRYNLWANFVICNTPENASGIDHLQWISPDYLLPALSPVYQEKLEKCLNQTRNPTALADNIVKITLTEKVPLSAF